jgi:hypothetical protein
MDRRKWFPRLPLVRAPEAMRIRLEDMGLVLQKKQAPLL